MSKIRWYSYEHGILLLLAGVLVLSACSREQGAAGTQAVAAPLPETGELVNAMLDTLGGREALEQVRVLVQKGGGMRRHFGQIPATGAPEPPGMLTGLVETIDLANDRAAFDNSVQIGGGFAQHRTEVYTTHQGQHLGWATTEGRPNHVTSVNGLFSWATHDTPEMLLRRNVITVALSALTAQPAVVPGERELDGRVYWYLDTRLGEETLGLYIDQQSMRLRAWRALDTERMWGDSNTLYVLDDYRPVGALFLPHQLEMRKDDGVYAQLRYAEISVNDDSALDIFAIPPDVQAQAHAVLAAGEQSWVELQWVPVAEGVTQIVAFSHNSMLVEFPSFVVLIEGPYTEAQSLTLARQIEQRIGKPIRYVVPSHPHYDHTGGIRGLASVGANVLVAGGHEGELRRIVESPHSNPPDALARNLAAGVEVGQVEVFRNSSEISEGEQRLQLFEVIGIPHVSPKVLAYVPSAGALFQSDLFFGGSGPDSRALLRAIRELDMQVEHIVGGHGGVLPFSALESAVAQSQ